MKRVKLKVTAGLTIRASTGRMGYHQLDRMSSWQFYKAVHGSYLCLLDKNYFYNVATYTKTFNEKQYIYTYDYEPEESWTTYAKDLSGDTYIQQDYVFHDEVYFRVCLKRADGADLTQDEANRIHEILAFYTPNGSYKGEACFQSEMIKTIAAVQTKRLQSSFLMAVLTDSHYTINGTWEDTVQNIRAVHEEVKFNAVIHLGDLTDGMVPADVTESYAKQMIYDLKQNQVPVHVVLGNHDSNYFRNNPEPIPFDHQCEIYQNHDDKKNKQFAALPFYYVNYEEYHLRLIFLVSFDRYEKIRYGFPLEEIAWLKEVLISTPENYRIVIFSHEGPLAEMDYWADEVRNGKLLLEVLENYNQQNHKKIMAFIHGHVHADYCCIKYSFPIISVGCNKCEQVLDKKAPNIVTPSRMLHTATQDLWDAVIVTPQENKIDFVRFGAGEDRSINLDEFK